MREVNVKSVVIAAQAFIPSAKPGAAFYAITAGALAIPPSMMPNISGYLSSKTAQVKIVESIAAENPNLFACSVHPGVVDTQLFRDCGSDPAKLPMDTGKCFFLLNMRHLAKQRSSSGVSRGLLGLVDSVEDCVLEWEDGVGELGCRRAVCEGG